MSVDIRRMSLGGLFLLVAACSDEPSALSHAAAVTSTDEPTTVESSSIAAQTAASRTSAVASASATKSTGGVVTASGFNAIGASNLLSAKDFDQRVHQIAVEGARVPGAADATLSVQKSLAGLAAVIDPNARIGATACNGDVCVASFQSGMDEAQWETWRAEFAKISEPERSATMYSPVRMPDGSKIYRMLMVTKPGSSGVNVPFHSLPTVEEARRQGLVAPKG